MQSSGDAPLMALRKFMHTASLAAVIVPSSDPHNSEYIAGRFKYREALTNFYGSAGTCVITAERALLWTDGRYWLAASQSLYPGWELMKQGLAEVPSVEEWVTEHVGKDGKVGMDPFHCTLMSWEEYARRFQIVAVPEMLGPLVPTTRDDCEQSSIFIHADRFAGASCGAKRDRLHAELRKRHCTTAVLSALDEVAWITNLRGSDVPYNPVFYAYAVVDTRSPHIHLFMDLEKVPEPVFQQRVEDVSFHPYEGLRSYIATLPMDSVVLVDELQTSMAVFDMVQQRGLSLKRLKCGPVQYMKAIKNDVEIDGFYRSHARDSVALTRYLAWLTDYVGTHGKSINEFDAAARLEEYRAEEEHYVQLSFPTISSTGPNGAIIHYQPTSTDSHIIRKDQLYLVDSGAQYLDGTTDVTRTICFQPPRAEERMAYTLVLKGYIGLNNAVWPEGLRDYRLDALARTALWQYGLDYSHGTSHGVGTFLNVHEGPQMIGFRPRPQEATLHRNMVISNEPGYYKEGAYGVRIENLEVIVPASTRYGGDTFNTLQPLTVTPLCYDLIDTQLLTEEEIAWVNTYHTQVTTVLTPLLMEKRDSRALDYLRYHTQKL